jgi:hypothetical protein
MAEPHPLHLLFIARRKTITDFLSALASSCIYLCIFLILAVLGLELKVSNCICVRQFLDRASQIICWLGIVILLILASFAAGITGISCWCPPLIFMRSLLLMPRFLMIQIYLPLEPFFFLCHIFALDLFI